MANMLAAAALAERLINANGRPLTLIHHGKDPLNSEQGWRAQVIPTQTEVTGVGVFVSESIFRDTEAGRRGHQYLLFAANDDGDYALETFNEVVDGITRWQIVNVQVLAPGAVRILYEFEVA